MAVMPKGPAIQSKNLKDPVTTLPNRKRPHLQTPIPPTLPWMSIPYLISPETKEMSPAKIMSGKRTKAPPTCDHQANFTGLSSRHGRDFLMRIA